MNRGQRGGANEEDEEEKEEEEAASGVLTPMESGPGLTSLSGEE